MEQITVNKLHNLTAEQAENLSEGTLKHVALKERLDEEFYVKDGKLYHDEECENELEELDDSEFNDYLVLTDEEADELAARYIRDSLWAFNASFIIEHSALPYEAEEMIKTFQENKCEGANDTIEAMIEDMDEFIEDAIKADGRGHFMSSYDGEEEELTVSLYPGNDGGNPTFYIYRLN